MSYFKMRMAEIEADLSMRRGSCDQTPEFAKVTNKRRRVVDDYTDGYVYFFKAGNSVKIGFSTNLKERAKSIQTGCPDAGFIAKYERGTPLRERYFHKKFAEYRLTGEWFGLRGRLAKYLERDVYPVGLPCPIDREPRPDRGDPGKYIRL